MKINTQPKKIKGNYYRSPHYLYTNNIEFNIKGCSGRFYIKRLNEFGDCVLMYYAINGWENAAVISLVRRGEILLSRHTMGITFEKRIKLNSITPL